MSPNRWFTLLALAAACSSDRTAESASTDATRGAAGNRVVMSDPSALAASLGVARDSLRAAAEERYGRQEYDSARAILEVEARRAQEAGDAAAEARARMWLGLAAWRLGDYGAARTEGERSLVMKRRLGLDREFSRSFNALGLLAWNEGRHRDALVNFDSALHAARRNDDASGVARAIGNIPLVQVELGEFDAAREGFEAAIAAGRAIEDDRTQGNALANLAMLELRLGQPQAALPLLAEARARYAAIEFSTGEANALGQLATAWGDLGEIQRAIAFADSGVALARRHGLLQEVAATLEVLADLHLQAGSPRLALMRLREADSLDALLGLAVERGNNLRRESIILLELGDPIGAAARASEAVIAHRSTDARAEVVYDLVTLATAYSQGANPRRARATAEQAIAAATASQNPVAVRAANAVAAQLALQVGDASRALRLLDMPRSGGLDDNWTVVDLRAAALVAAKRLTEARKEAERAVALVDRERASIGDGPLRTGFLANRTAPYARLVAIHLALHDTAAAFRVAASVPGRNLAERASGLAVGMRATGMPAHGEALLRRAAALESEIAGLDGVESSERRDHLARVLTATRNAYEEFLAGRATSPSGKLRPPGDAQLSEVQAHLGPDEALITYLTGPDQVDAFVIRRTRVMHHSIPIGGRELGARVRLTRTLMYRPPSAYQPIPAPLADLHRILLAPAISHGVLEGVTHLTIVAHGPLGALPFAALWNRESGRFLIEDMIVSHLPAVAMITRPIAHAAVTGRRAAIFAPFPDSLPGTGREARAIALSLAGADLRLGRRSDEGAVRRALASARIIHLASHGSSNLQNPIFSRMLVGRGGARETNNDGRLEVHEVLSMSINAPLVFLSGCETGVGTAGGTGFMPGSEDGSLAHAFLIAGADHVVATLWIVGDAGAAALAEGFYRHLGPGVHPAEALARAQREAIARRRDGFTWAAYTATSAGRRKSQGAVREIANRP